MKKKQELAPIHEEAITITPQQEKMLRDRMPQWVKELESDGNAVLRWNTEFAYLIQGILAKDFGFTEKQNAELMQKVKEALPTLHKLTVKGIVLLNPATMKVALDIVDEMKKQIEQGQSKIALPSKNEIKKLG